MSMEVGGPCTYSGCRRTAQFNSEFCYQHRNESTVPSHISTNSDEVSSDDGPGISNQLIRFEIDGKKKTVDSKEIEYLLNRLEKAKKFWIVDLTVDENEFVQYAIEKYENEEELLSKLSSVLPEKDIQRSLDTLIGTQKVRRIGPEIIQNNTSHTELPELPDNVKELLDKI